jgi:ornithine carbamoyltransferase
MRLTGRSLLTLKDFSRDEIIALLDLSDALKAKKKSGKRDLLLEGKNIVLLFDKPSTRTRCAFEVAAFDEGANVTFLTNSQMGKKESIEDTARVLGRYYDGMQYRGSSQKLVEDLARFSGIPVWNGLTDEDHPTQVLADFMTAREHLAKPLDKMKFVYVGDGRNNMANALMIGAAKVGMDYVIASPKQLFPSGELIDSLAGDRNISGGTVSCETDPFKAVVGADIIYTDVWVSMGEEDQMTSRIALLEPYRVTMELLAASGNPDVIFQHCLPSFHDLETSIGKDVFEKFGLKEMEVTDEVFRSPRSVVFDEAENRMHTIKAVMVATMSDKTY